MPLSQTAVLNTVRSKIPPLLASASEFFIPPSLGYYDPKIVHQTTPLSAAALHKVHEIIEGFFIQKGQASESKHRRNLVVNGVQECSNLITLVLTELAMLLKKALKTAQVELDDILPFGQKGCKEWIFGMFASKKGLLNSAATDELLMDD